MKRRGFLKTIVAGAGATVVPVRAFAQGFRGAVAPQGYPVIAHVDWQTSFSHLIGVLDAFGARSIPVTCLVSPYDGAGRPLGADSALARLLSGLLLGGSSIEIAPFLPDLADRSQYFQARAAHDAVQALQGMLAPVAESLPAPLRVQTLACRSVPRPASPEALRSAGIFNVLSLPAWSSEVRSETWDNGVARLFGGTLCDIRVPPTTGPSAPGTQTVYYMSAAAFGKMPLAEAEAAAERFAEALSQQELEGERSLLQVYDLQLRDAYQFQRVICLHLVDPMALSGPERWAYTGLQSTLERLNIPYTQGSDLGSSGPPEYAGLWVETDADQFGARADQAWPTAIPVQIAPGGDGRLANVRTARPLAPGIGVRAAVGAAAPGLGKDGILTVPHRDIKTPLLREALPAVFAGVKDQLIVLHPEAFVDERAQQDLAQHLKSLPSDGITVFRSLDDYTRLIAPESPMCLRQRRLAAARPAIVPKAPGVGEAVRDELLQDAAVAWRYLEEFTNPETGLCPATVNFAPGGELLEAVTMWDVGSHINALVAASQIGLIDETGLETAVSKILPNIAGRVSDDRRLPQGWIRTDRRRWGNRDFDGSDAGRLLSSLDNLRRNSGFGDRLTELVASYDFKKIIKGGEIYSVLEGDLKSTYISHSAHYAARAFRRWGLQVKSPYEVLAGRSEADGQMALLEAASRIGPFGAEPLLLEAMELGMSPESAYLADVLFSAQLEDYNETGRLICVSEGAINKSPWFLYQGLQLDAAPRIWAIDSVDLEPEYRTRAFVEENLVVSSKAAFLWSAYKPHDYSELLRAYVRNTAKTRNGYASSIFVKSGQPTSAYSDLNTNCVILQAIAHRLKATG
ncbi:MAG: twin-arginine translocation pathway signal [Alphaproteobacteria bacterium MedPE-SWcel]|nr:MAG: twin-arginine translocation pathway signal [Alphaproteobacteria bacterium MedPE-SWcel]